MARPKPALVLSDDERQKLTTWAGPSTQRLALRARIVLECAAGPGNKAVAARLGVCNAAVGMWRSRFVAWRPRRRTGDCRGRASRVARAAGDPEPIGTVNIREVSKPLLKERLTRCAKWKKKGRGDDIRFVPAHPPDWSIGAVRARTYWKQIRILDGAVTHPVLLGDGTLRSKNGYGERSSLYPRMPPGLSIVIPDRPTRADMTAAVDRIGDVIRDLPFELRVHRAAGQILLPWSRTDVFHRRQPPNCR